MIPIYSVIIGLHTINSWFYSAYPFSSVIRRLVLIWIGAPFLKLPVWAAFPLHLAASPLKKIYFPRYKRQTTWWLVRPLGMPPLAASARPVAAYWQKAGKHASSKSKAIRCTRSTKANSVCGDRPPCRESTTRIDLKPQCLRKTENGGHCPFQKPNPS